jgi:two-component system, OmpR family, sensor histidine kinase BaeS
MSPTEPRGHHPAQPGALWWRRRFLRVAVVIVVLWVGAGVLFGVLTNRAGRHGEDRGPPIAVAVIGAAVVATVVAYRRLARPVSELLDGAERIGAGDYEARVEPFGPRAVRTLGTAFNEMASRLDASETARRRFLADIAHELRTPLAVLQAGIEAQLDGIHPRDDEHLAVLREQTRTLDRLVEDLRTLALGDAGRLALHIEIVGIGSIAADASAAISAAAVSRGVEIVTQGDDVELDADPVRLTQILVNLLANAVRHTPPGGVVTVTTEAVAGDVMVTVADSGPGISGDPQRIFDRFVRAADSGGSGLGLTIARQLVDLHGGTVVATNDPAGGARFTVTLPRRQPAGSP